MVKVIRVPLLAFFIILVSALLISGCRDPYRDNGGPLGSAAQIDRVNFYYYDESAQEYFTTSYFYLGEKVYVEVAVTDPDRDIRGLVSAQIHHESGVSIPRSVDVAEQTSETMWYYTAFEMVGPAGEQEVLFTIVDAAGNHSEPYAVAVTVY